jgi:fatty-acyl-CoA synthase
MTGAALCPATCGRLAAKTRSSVTLLRANTVFPERPDRLARATLAVLAHGRGLAGAVAASAARYPHATAIKAAGQEVTYQQLWLGSGSLAHGLLASGVTAQSRIGVLCRNSPLFCFVLIAAARLGVDVVLLNTGLGRGQLLDTIRAESVDLVLHDDEFTTALSGLPTLGAARLSEIIGAGLGDRLPAPPRESRLVVLTSGTTGRPKGASRPSGGAAADGVAALLGRIPLRARDTVVIAAPFFHAWGLAMLTIGLGLTATIVTSPTFDAADALTLVDSNRAAVLVVVPTMLQRVCALPPQVLAAADPDSLRVIASSGSALPARLVTEVLDRFGPVLYNVYGSTEVATATVATPADLLAAPTTAGRPAPGVRVAILGADGAPVDRAVTGRIFVGNAARFDGYTGGGGKESVRGMLSSGDLGHFDTSGRLFIDGREDDMIVSGGENVYPREIEELLNGHDAIAEAVVVGTDDETFGQALKAVIVLRDPDAPVDVEQLKQYVATRLARYKVPRAFQIVEDLPRTATGKVIRRELT